MLSRTLASTCKLRMSSSRVAALQKAVGVMLGAVRSPEPVTAGPSYALALHRVDSGIGH